MEGLESAFFGAPEPVFDLGEDLLDWVEVRRIWWKEQQFCPDLFYGLANRIAFMRREIVHHDNIAGAELSGHELLDIGLKDCPVHRAVDGHRGHDTVIS